LAKPLQIEYSFLLLLRMSSPVPTDSQIEQAMQQADALADARLNNELAQVINNQVNDKHLDDLRGDYVYHTGQTIPYHPIFRGELTTEELADGTVPNQVLSSEMIDSGPTPSKLAQALQKAFVRAGERIRRECSLGLHRGLEWEQQRQLVAEYSQAAGASILHHPAFKYGLGKWLVEYTPNSKKLNGKTLYETLNALSLHEGAEWDNEDVNVFRHLISELCEERIAQGLPPTTAAAAIIKWLNDKPLHDFMRDYLPAMRLGEPVLGDKISSGLLANDAKRIDHPEVEEEAVAAFFNQPTTEAAGPSLTTEKHSSAKGKPGRIPVKSELRLKSGVKLEDLDEIAMSIPVIRMLDGKPQIIPGQRNQAELAAFVDAVRASGVTREKSIAFLRNFFSHRYGREYVLTRKNKRDSYNEAYDKVQEQLKTLLSKR
jgi:hypothetical protein